MIKCGGMGLWEDEERASTERKEVRYCLRMGKNKMHVNVLVHQQNLTSFHEHIYNSMRFVPRSQQIIF